MVDLQSSALDKSDYPAPPEAGSVVLGDASAQRRLLDAIEASDLKGIRAALKAGAEVNYWAFGDGKDQATYSFPLSLAMEGGDRKVVKLLLDSGAAVNFEDCAWQAVGREDLPLLKLVLKHGASPDGVRYWKPSWDDKDGNETALTRAAAAGRHTMVKALLEAGANAEHENDEGDSALLIALRSGDKRMAKLVEGFVSEAYRSRMEGLYGEEHEAALKLDEALSDAITEGRADEVRRLIVEEQRDVGELLLTGDGSLLQYALGCYNQIVYRGMDGTWWKKRPLPESPEPMVEVIKVLLDLDAPVDTLHYNTPLHEGIGLCDAYPDLYEEMLRRAETVDVVGLMHSSTPLMGVCIRGELAPARMLLKYGADPNRKDASGRSVIEMVRFQQKYRPDDEALKEVVRILFDAGAKEAEPSV